MEGDDFFAMVADKSWALAMVSLKIKPRLKGFRPALRLFPGGRIGPQPTKVCDPKPNPSIFLDKGINPLKFVVEGPSGFSLKKKAKPR